MLNRNSIVSVVFCLVLPLFLLCAALFDSLNPPLILIVVCALSPLVAAFFGHAARRQIRKDGQARAKGYGLAAATLTVGYLEIVFVAFVLLSSGHHPSHVLSSEASAVGSMRTLNVAARAYANAHPRNGFPKGLKDLSWNNRQPETDWSIDEVLASGVKASYRFMYVAKSSKVNGKIDAYQIFADPVDSRNKDMRHSFTDQTGVIRSTVDGNAANESSPELK